MQEIFYIIALSLGSITAIFILTKLMVFLKENKKEAADVLI